MKTIKLIILISLILGFGCSTSYKFHKANRLYLQSNYRKAIEKYDEFIDHKKNSALQTQAELERSDCYYQLGYNEFHKKNWELASHYLYLANSEIADSILDICYDKLAAIALDNGETQQALQYYAYIIDYLPNSSIYNDIIIERIKLKVQQEDYASAFQDYQLLWERAPNSEQRQAIQPLIDDFVPILLQKADLLRMEEKYEEAVNELSEFTKYPLLQHDKIINDICELYLILADLQIAKNAYRSARSYFDQTIDTCPDKTRIVDDKIEIICADIIAEADRLQEQLQFDAAITKYNLCYILRQEHPEADTRIAAAEENKANYLKAVEFENIGQKQEDNNDFNAALQSYRQSASYYNSERIRQKIFSMKNLIEAEKDPKGFALKIITNHDNGKIIKNLEVLKQNMKARYGQYAQFSDWKVTYAIGNYKYEVRYDVISPDETFYFAWRINLVTQKITPSNRVSENLMLTGNIMQHQKQE